MRIVLKRGDITRESVGAIVNAANSTLLGGGGVDGAIHRAGGPAILRECEVIVVKQGRLPTGQAVVTTGGELPATYVIHTVGPVWGGGTRGEPELLADAYRNSLRAAVEKGARRVGFPSISTGVYRFPIEKASRIAVESVRAFVEENGAPAEVIFVLYSAADYAIYADLFDEIIAKG